MYHVTVHRTLSQQPHQADISMCNDNRQRSYRPSVITGSLLSYLINDGPQGNGETSHLAVNMDRARALRVVALFFAAVANSVLAEGKYLFFYDLFIVILLKRVDQCCAFTCPHSMLGKSTGTTRE